MESCEGCELPGTVDWCGHWLCSACHQIEREHADPVLARMMREEREAVARKALVDSWSASYRGASMGEMREWNLSVVRHCERTQAR